MAEPRFKPDMQDQMLLLPPSLEDLVPENSLIRVVDAVVRSLDRSRLVALYPGGGASAYDPQVLLKVVLYCYAKGTYSSRGMEAATREDVGLLWVTGLRPVDHNTLNRFRTDRIRPVFEEVFAEVVLLLADKGYVDLSTYFLDGTVVEANANRNTFVWSKATEAYMGKLREKVRAHLAAIDEICEEEERLAPEEPEAVGSDEIREAAARINERLRAREEAGEGRSGQAGELRRAAREAERDWIPRMERYEGQMRTAAGRSSFSRTDPDATFMRMKEDRGAEGARPRAAYNVQASTSGQYLVGATLHQTPGDSGLLVPHLGRLEGLYGGWLPGALVADGAYGSQENYEWLEGRRVKALVANGETRRLSKAKYRDDPFRPANWAYDELADCYTCPAGKALHHVGPQSRTTSGGFLQSFEVYECDDCSGCGVAERCRGKRGAASEAPRTLCVNAELDRLRAQADELLSSPCGKAVYARRKDDVETFFGDLKQNMGFKRFSLRGLSKCSHEFLLAGMGHNLRKLAKAVAGKAREGLSAPMGAGAPAKAAAPA